MYFAEKVKIDVAMAERYMAFHKLSKAEFSQKMGHSRSWWYGIRKVEGYMPVNQAKLLCHMLGVEYDKIVIPEPRISTPCNIQKNVLEEDESLLQALVNCMNRIEKKVDEAALNTNRLEIQMRTVLKELGVK